MEEVIVVLATVASGLAWATTVGWQRAGVAERRAVELAAELAHERAWRMVRVFADAARPTGASVLRLLGRAQ